MTPCFFLFFLLILDCLGSLRLPDRLPAGPVNLDGFRGNLRPRRLPKTDAGNPHVDLGGCVEDLEDGDQEADTAEADEVESIQDAHDAPEDIHNAPKQQELRGLAADNEAAAAALLLHHSEPAQVREDVGDNDLLQEVLDPARHAGGAIADDQDQERDDPHDHTGPELDHAPLPIDLLPVALLALKDLLDRDRTERLLQHREVLVAGAGPLLDQRDIAEGELQAARHSCLLFKIDCVLLTW